MLYKNYIVNKMNLIILFVFMLSENEAFLISDRFNYKYDIIQDIFVYENIDLCTNDIFITFMHENVEKYGYLNRNKEIIDESYEIPCKKILESFYINTKLKISRYDHFLSLESIDEKENYSIQTYSDAAKIYTQRTNSTKIGSASEESFKTAKAESHRLTTTASPSSTATASPSSTSTPTQTSTTISTTTKVLYSKKSSYIIKHDELTQKSIKTLNEFNFKKEFSFYSFFDDLNDIILWTLLIFNNLFFFIWSNIKKKKKVPFSNGLIEIEQYPCSLEYEKDIMIHSDIFKNSEQNNFSLLNIENENFNKPNTNESLTNNENIIDKDLTDSMDKELIKCNLCGKSFKPKGININLNFCKKKHGF